MKTITKLKLILAGSVIVILLVTPVELFHASAWLVIHVYELIEFALDEIIHHFFDTARHTTQVIVFYIMAGLIVLSLYALWCWVVRTYRQMQQELSRQWPLWKHLAFNYWQNLPQNQKIKMLSAVSFGGVFMAFWALS